MNIIEAAKLLRKGHKIRSNHWDEKSYIQENLMGKIIDEKDKRFEMSSEHFLHNGWEKYKEYKEYIEITKPIEEASSNTLVKVVDAILEQLDCELGLFESLSGLTADEVLERLTADLHRLRKSYNPDNFFKAMEALKNGKRIRRTESGDWEIMNEPVSNSYADLMKVLNLKW